MAGETHRDVEPEDGVVVALRGARQVDESLRETAVLQVGGYSREDDEHARHAVVLGGEDTGQDDAEDEVQHLRGGVVKAAPHQPPGCLFLQVALHTHRCT